VYELEGHPDYDYCYGDVVVRLSPVSVCLETASVGESTEKSTQKIEESGIKINVNVQTGETCVQFSDLSWVGNITGLKNGDIEVTWADGMVSMVCSFCRFIFSFLCYFFLLSLCIYTHKHTHIYIYIASYLSHWKLKNCLKYFNDWWKFKHSKFFKCLELDMWIVDKCGWLNRHAHFWVTSRV